MSHKNPKIFVLSLPQEEKPLCKCHNEPMLRQPVSKNVTLKNGRTHYWRCAVKRREWGIENRKKQDPEKKYRVYRDARLKKFGITESEYEEMLSSQGGKCAICGGGPDTRWKMLAVDHDHTTGKVRGLLCMVCNTTLGRVESRFDNMMQYLGVYYEK